MDKVVKLSDLIKQAEKAVERHPVPERRNHSEPFPIERRKSE